MWTRRFMYFGVLWQSCTALLQLAPLPYAYNALEPHLDEATMQLHHLRHLQGYVDRTNAILQSMRESGIASAHRIAKLGLDYALLHLDEVQDEGQRRALRNVGGGVINHELFFSSLSPPPPVGHGGVILQDLEVVTAIEAAFGSMESFKERMRSAALAVFGSGWAFLEVDGRGSGAPTLNITMAANQDSPAMEAGRHPLLGLDVWEHAYYLRFNNRRADYIDALWHVIDWHVIDARYRRVVAQGGGSDAAAAQEL